MKILKIFSIAGISVLFFLQTSCQHEPELIPGTTEVCFDSQVMLIINSNCNVSGCHNSGGGELPALNTYEDISRLVKPGKPMESELHEVLTANPNSEKFMPPKPKQALTSAQIDEISLWILQGAKNTSCGKSKL